MALMSYLIQNDCSADCEVQQQNILHIIQQSVRLSCIERKYKDFFQ